MILAQHLTVMWVAMEGTTLTTALLLYFNQNRRSLEATWKYLMIGSVGIALALLGTLFMAYAALIGLGDPTLVFPDLVRRAVDKVDAKNGKVGYVIVKRNLPIDMDVQFRVFVKSPLKDGFVNADKNGKLIGE